MTHLDNVCVLSSVQTLWLTPKASESGKGGERGQRNRGHYILVVAGPGSVGGQPLCRLWVLPWESRAWEGAGVRGHLLGGCTGPLQPVSVGVCSCSHAPRWPACVSHCPSSATGVHSNPWSHLQALADKSAVVTLEQVGGGRKVALSAGIASLRNDTRG